MSLINKADSVKARLASHSTGTPTSKLSLITQPESDSDNDDVEIDSEVRDTPDYRKLVKPSTDNRKSVVALQNDMTGDSDDDVMHEVEDDGNSSHYTKPTPPSPVKKMGTSGKNKTQQKTAAGGKAAPKKKGAAAVPAPPPPAPKDSEDDDSDNDEDERPFKGNTKRKAVNGVVDEPEDEEEHEEAGKAKKAKKATGGGSKGGRRALEYLETWPELFEHVATCNAAHDWKIKCLLSMTNLILRQQSFINPQETARRDALATIKPLFENLVAK